MDSILYGNFRIDILTETGHRLERHSLQRADPPRAPSASATDGAATAPSLLEREEVLHRLRRAVQAGEHIELTAPCGYGKTRLLHQLVATDGGADGGRPWVYLRLGQEGLDDSLHRLFEASYTSPQRFKPTPGQRTRLLAQVSSVVLLDDLTLSPGEVARLVGDLPNCRLVVASSRPSLGGHGSTVTLTGLSDRAAVELVTAELGRPLTEPEEAAVRDLAAAVQGQPLHLRQAAALAREDGHSLAGLARQAARDPLVLDRLGVNALAEHERRALAVLALAGGALLPRTLIGAVGDVATIAETLGLLRRRGLVEQDEDRFGLPVCAINAYRELLLQYLQLGGAIGSIGDWLQARPPTGEEARSAVAGAVNALGYAAQHGQWPAVVRLVRILEPILTLTGRWEASRQVLEQGLTAATAIGDQAAEALFSHQLGTLQLSLDDLDEARENLERALRLREQLGDRAGVAVSSHNLRMLLPEDPVDDDRPATPQRRPVLAEWGQALARRWPVLAGRAAVVGLTFLLGVLLFPRGPGTPQPLSQPPGTSATTTTVPPPGPTTDPGTTSTTGRRDRPTPGLPDTTPPTLRLPSGLVEEASSGNGARVTFAASAADRVDGPVPVICTPASGSTFPLGATPVACSAVDRDGFAASGTFQVVVLDQSPPTLRVPPGLVEEATSSGGARVTFAASAADRVDGPVPVICTPPSGSTFPLGGTSVSCSAVDAAGFAANRDFPVTVRDTRKPELTLPANLTVRAPATEGAEVAYQSSASDAVDGTISPTCTPPSGGRFRVGTTQVGCSATDKAGNRATGGFEVTVREPEQPGGDTAPPALELPEDLTAEAASAAGAVVTFNASATDLVDGPVPVGCTPASGATFPLGTTTVACSAEDRAGNDATGSFELTVADRTPPELSLPNDLTLGATSPAGAPVTYSASATDLVDGAVPVSCTPASNSTVRLGSTSVGCSATDKAGNRATGSFSVTVEDDTPPILTLPGDLTVEATSAKGAEVRYPASATDLVDGTVPVRCTPASATTFPLAVTTVSCSSVDKAGNRATGSFSITVQDRTAPKLTLPEDMVLEATSAKGAEVTSYDASATDLVDGPVRVDCPPDPPRIFPLGATTVTCSAVDKAGNRATGSFVVSVQDRTPPRLELPTDMTVEAGSASGAQVTYAASATDLVDGAVLVTCRPPSGDTFPLDTTTATCSAADKAGNTATGSFQVTVRDRTPPTLELPSDIVEQTYSRDGASVTYSASATDLVDGPVKVDCKPRSGDTFPVDTITVNCSAIDNADNEATGSFKVTLQLFQIGIKQKPETRAE